MGARGLRWVALLGVPAVVVVRLVEDTVWGPRDASASIAAAVVCSAALLVLRLPPLRRSAGTVFRSPDVLVPLAALLVVETCLGHLIPLLPILGASQTLTGLPLTLEVSALAVLILLLTVAAGAWSTLLLLDLAAGREVALLGTLRRLPRAFLPSLAAVAVGHAPLLLLVALMLALAPATDGGALLVGLPILLLATLVWNLWTAGLLPVVLSSGGSMIGRLRAGLASGRGRVRVWALPILLQLLLLGVVTFASVQYWTSDVTAQGTESRSVSRVSWNVHGKWVGGYDDESKWYAAYAAALEAEVRAVPSTLLRIVMLLVAVAVKYHVITTLRVPRIEAVPRPGGGDAPEDRPGAAEPRP